jgi:transcriptional regulator with XRE-family HTH domain
MGTHSRRKPARLAEKLLAIRTELLGLSQNGLIRKMGLQDELSQAEVSMFESGKRVPSLPVILEIARVARVPVEVLIDDAQDLPLLKKTLSTKRETKRQSARKKH